MTAFDPALAARIAATGVPLTADMVPLSAEREAEIREHVATTKNWSIGNLAARALLAELDAVRKERDKARAALRDATDQIAELESDFAGAVVVSEALNRRLFEEQLAGSALYAALTMPTTPAQRQAALDKFTAVAQQVFGSEATR